MAERNSNPTPKPVIEAASSLKKIDTLIKAVGAAYGNAQVKVQEAGLAVIAHAMAYGDCTRAARLARTVPARERNSLIGWFSLYSPIGIALGKTAVDDNARFVKPESKNFHGFDIDGATANNWWEDPANANPEPKPLNTLVDFYAVVNRILERAIKDAAKTGDDAKYREEDRLETINQARELQVLVTRQQAKHLASIEASKKPEDEAVPEKTEAKETAAEAMLRAA